MTDYEKVELVKVLINDSSVTEDNITVYLSLAMHKILERCYPFKDVDAVNEEGNLKYPMPKRYEHLQCELASRMIVRRGVEGQVSSSVNGVSRTFATANDEDLLKEVVQRIGV